MFLHNNNKRFLLLAALLFAFFIKINAQTELKIGGNAGSIAPSAVFEVQSTTKGLLLPRMTTAQMNLIASPATGLMVYNTDLNCVHYYFGTWKSQCDPANLGAWSLLGNAGTNATNNFVGTTDNIGLSFRTNNVLRASISPAGNFGVGIAAPLYKLDVQGTNPLRLNGLQSGALTDSILTSNAGVVRRLSASDLFQANAWALDGNNVTTIKNLGTTSNFALPFITNNTEKMRLNENGHLILGTINYFSAISGGNAFQVYRGGGASGDLRTHIVGGNTTISVYRTLGSGGLMQFHQGRGSEAAPSSSLATDVIGTITWLGRNSLGNFMNGSQNPQIFAEVVDPLSTSEEVNLKFRSGKAGKAGVDLTIAPSGNIGIGITTPTYKLDVQGTNPLRLNGLVAGALTDSILTSNAGVVRRISVGQLTGATTNTLGLSGNTLTSTVNGIAATSNSVSTVANTSAVNILTTTVNGVAGTGVNIINTNATSLSGTNLTTTVNGVASTPLDISSAVNSTAWSLLGNTGTNASTNFIGTTDSKPFNIRVNNQKSGRIDSDVSGETYFGYQAGNASNTASGVTAIGYQAGRLNTGNENTFTGYQTGYSNTTGNENTFTGFQAGYSNTTGYFNLFTGNQAGHANTTGNANVALGYFANYANTTGGSNVAVGFAALKSNTIEGANVAIGSQSMENSTIGEYNVAVGASTLKANKSNNNVAIGYQALYENTTGSGNIGIGTNAAGSNTTGGANTAVGYGAMINSTTGSSNTAIGDRTLYSNISGTLNNALGVWSMYGNTTGSGNTALGTFSLNSNNTGNDNVAIGNNALYTTNGSRNVGLGNSAGSRVSSGTDNLLLGNASGDYLTSGSRNLILGYQSGAQITTGNNNTLIGVGANVTASGGAFTNSTALGYNAIVGASNSLVLGGTGADAVNVGIGLITPAYKLDIASTANPIRMTGLQTGAATDDIITTDAAGVLRKQTSASLIGNNAWSLLGNTGTNASTNFIGTTDAIDFVTRTNNTERMRVASNGNVGIGIAIPTAKLHIVDGSLDLKASAAGGFQVETTGASAWTNLGTNSTAAILQWYNSSNTGLGVINSVGRMGIGTISPTSKLHIIGEDNVADTEISSTLANNSTQGVAIKYGGIYKTGSNATSSLDINAKGTGNIVLHASASGATASTGNVGIGNNNPSYKLDVAGSFRIASASAGGGYLRTWGETDIEYDGGADGLYSFRNSTTGGSTRFLGDVEIMRLLNNGNVGIGTSTPGTKLEIDGAVAVRSSGVTVTADNQVITVGNRSYIKLTGDATPSNRTITLSGGLSDGQILIISVIGTGTNGIELADSGNLNLSGLMQLDNGDTIQLIWDGTSWSEITRSSN